MIHDFSLLTTELGRHDAEIERFVTSSKAALGNFANQQQSIQESLVEFPATLTRAALGAGQLEPLLHRGPPGAARPDPAGAGLGPALRANERLFKQTTGPIRDQIRPFTRQIRPVLTHTAQGAADFNKTSPASATRSAPSTASSTSSPTSRRARRQSFLFYLPWLNHDLNASFNLPDGGGPVLPQPGAALLQRLLPRLQRDRRQR